jgi:hypothetical protein
MGRFDPERPPTQNLIGSQTIATSGLILYDCLPTTFGDEMLPATRQGEAGSI